VGSLLVADATVAVAAGGSMGGQSKNSYSALMCEQSPSSWFCISNAQRENLIKLKRQGCTSYECPSGFIYKPNVAALKCKAAKAPTNTHAHMCTDEDKEHCCDEQAKCTTYTCPYGWLEGDNYGSALCNGPACSMLDASTCCTVPKVTCHEVKFQTTPDGDAAHEATTLRTCRKEAKQDADKEFTTSSSFLGKVKNVEECFALKVEMKKDMGTTRTPVKPGPAESKSNYGKPAPRPTTMAGDDRVVVDAAARGDETSLCKGFDCEEGGDYNSDSDNDWQEFLDVSYNHKTMECHSCTPEDAAAKDPSAFGVSRTSGDAVFDCACTAKTYLHNGRCIGYVANKDDSGDNNGECFPSYGDGGASFINANNKKMAKKNHYFPCDAATSICADKVCTLAGEVKWDCKNGQACNADSEGCSFEDDCGVCGGDHLSCLECESLYQEFKAQKQCRLVEDVEDYVKGQHQLAKDLVEKYKWQLKNPKTIKIRNDAKAALPAAEKALEDSAVEVTRLEGLVETKVEEISTANPLWDKKCWQNVANDCERPSICKVDATEAAPAACNAAYANGGCGLEADTNGKQTAIIGNIGAKEIAIGAKKTECGTLSGREETDDAAATVSETTTTTAAAAAPVRRLAEVDAAAVEACMDQLKVLQTELKTLEDELSVEKRAFTRAVEDIAGMGVECFGCIAEMAKTAGC